MNGYRVQLASRAHVADVPRIERAAATLFSPEDLPLALRYRVTDLDVVRDAQREGRLWVGLDISDTPVGFALADTMADDAFLDEVDVTPAHGRRGLGRRLVRTVVDWAAARGHPGLVLVTFRHLPWNAPFYASLGFMALSDGELGAGLRRRLRIERAAGIDVRKRVAMRLALG